ncbi:hypothetical protein [Nonomuraea sediminis]|uniref:hypothetical protein n=1 Tax=Nonomuraea sediminis TaxID=2835864 RepID=UPI001BDCCD17|nr:hypothetical protein [Nonomuraea sediminis]
MSFGDIVSAEVIKIRTIPAYLVAAAVAILLTGLGALTVARSLDPQGHVPLFARGDMAASAGSSVNAITIPSDVLLYVMMVIGVLIATADLRSGTLRVASVMVPWRGRLLAAKFTAAAAAGLVVALAGLVLGYLGGLLGAPGAYSPLSGGGAVVLLSILLAVPLAAVLGTAFGLLLRSTAAAVAALLIWALGVEQVLLFILPSSVSAYLPFKTIGANAAIIGVLGPLPGLAYFAAIVAAAVALATVLHTRRDLT